MIINKIQQTHFSASEAEIVRYILSHSNDLEHMTIKQIADATYTSAPLLVRISKKLGYDGWSSLKKAMVEEFAYIYTTQEVDASVPFLQGDDMVTIANNLITLHKETAEDTRSLLTHDDLSKAFSILRKAKVIDIYAKAEYELEANIFCRRMQGIGHPVTFMSDPITQAAMSDETHAAIVISYSGETRRVIRAVKKIKSKNTPIIAITSISHGTLSSLADVSLRMSSREMLNTKIGSFATTESILVLLDILYSGVFSFDYDNNLDFRLRLAQEIDDSHTEYEFIDEEGES